MALKLKDIVTDQEWEEEMPRWAMKYYYYDMYRQIWYRYPNNRQ